VKYARICLMILVVAAVGFGVAACRKSAEQTVDEEPLLLLEDEDGSNEPAEASGPVADNSRCYVCHTNFDGEGLTAMHAKYDIGCEGCHWASDKHCSDEDNITPPDQMFAKEDINDFCKGCHPEGKLSEGKKYCVECHGKHQMEHRTRRWDKKTGELLEDDKVRMLTDEMLKDK
jgi:hypothetical protein